MSGFSQNITNPYPDSNQLFDPVQAIQARQTIQSNQLANQGNQLKLSDANVQQVGQAAAGLLSAYPDEASRAAAYPKVVGMLQAQGFAKNAPAQYPGEGVLRSLVNMGLSPKDLYSSGALLTPAQQQVLGTGGGTGGGGQPGVTIPSYGTGSPGASATVPAEYMPYFQEASQKTGIPVDLLIAQARQESGFRADAKGAAGEIGMFQIKPSTASDPGGGVQGVDPATLAGPGNVRNNILFGAQYLKSRMQGDPANPAVQVAGLRAYNGGGDPNYVQNVFRYRPAPAQPGATTASAAPPAASVTPGGGVTPAPYQVASNAPVAPPGAVAAPAQAPAQGDEFDVPQAAAPAQPAQPPAAPATPASPAAPASTSSLPDVSTIPTGRNSQAWQEAQQKINYGNQLLKVAGSNENLVRQAQAYITQGAAEQNLDHIVQAQRGGRPGNYNTTTGQFTPDAALPAPRPLQNSSAVWNTATRQWEPTTPDTAANAVPGAWEYGTNGRADFNPSPTQPAGGSYERQSKAYDGDLSTIRQIGEAGRNAQASTLQLNELADVIKNVPTGGLAPEFRAKVAALLEANGAKPETIKAYTGMESGSDAQVLQKLAVATIGASAKSDLGSNVGVNSLNLYAGANPGLDKLPDANKRVTNMIRVARAQVEGYSLGAQQFFNQNQSKILHSGPGQPSDYHPLSEYDAQWQAQNNPQIGAAAIGILNGDGFDKWAARAGPADAMNAVQLAARIDPNVKIPVKGGGFKSAQDVLNHPGSQ